jgi:hypothetical protein
MGPLALFVVAALAFSVLAGLMEIRGARRARHRLQQRALPVLHPLSTHPMRRVRYWSRRRTLHHVGLFIGFLVAVYVGATIVQAIHALLAHWF